MMDLAEEELKKSTDYFSYGNKLNETFSLTDKIVNDISDTIVVFTLTDIFFIHSHTSNKRQL